MPTHSPPASLRPSLTWAELLPAIRLGAWVVALFAMALVLARMYSAPIQDMLHAHPRLAILIFVTTSAVAVLMPVLSNLPLVPLAVLAWGPGGGSTLHQCSNGASSFDTSTQRHP